MCVGPHDVISFYYDYFVKQFSAIIIIHIIVLC